MLLDLPFELLVQVAGGLEARDLVNLSETSRCLNSVSRESQLWYNLIETKKCFHSGRDYREEYAWRHGTLAVDVQSHLAPKDEEIFKVMSFFPLHRSYKGRDLAALSPEYLPWATEHLAEADEDDLLILACRKDSLIAHVYSNDDSSGGARHRILILREGRETVTLTGLPDWPLCASLVGTTHVLVCGRFPAALLYDLESPDSPSGLPLSSHTINCLSFDDSRVEQRILLCGHYKGRGSMEMLRYRHGDEVGGSQGPLKLVSAESNKFAGVTTIVSCAYLPGGSFVTYDNYGHIYLWSSVHDALRKVDHDGIGDEIPSDMIYKMFYSEGRLLFVDQYRRQHAFVIRPGRQQEVTTHDTTAASSHASEERTGSTEEDAQLGRLLLRQGSDMAALARRILGM